MRTNGLIAMDGVGVLSWLHCAIMRSTRRRIPPSRNGLHSSACLILISIFP